MARKRVNENMTRLSLLNKEKDFGNQYNSLYETTKVLGAGNARAMKYFGWSIYNKKHINSKTTVFPQDKKTPPTKENGVEVCFEGTEYYLRRRNEFANDGGVRYWENKFDYLRSKKEIKGYSWKGIIGAVILLLVSLFGIIIGIITALPPIWKTLMKGADNIAKPMPEFINKIYAANELLIGVQSIDNIIYGVLAAVIAVVFLCFFIKACCILDAPRKKRKREKEMFKCMKEGRGAVYNVCGKSGIPTKGEKKQRDFLNVNIGNWGPVGPGGAMMQKPWESPDDDNPYEEYEPEYKSGYRCE